jgi:hypothetical protein
MIKYLSSLQDMHKKELNENEKIIIKVPSKKNISTENPIEQKSKLERERKINTDDNKVIEKNKDKENYSNYKQKVKKFSVQIFKSKQKII